MIHLLDILMRDVFLEKVDQLSDSAQVGFQPPDESWRNYVSGLTIRSGQPSNALNVYLVELRENRKLRSNERIRRIENGVVTEKPIPDRIDCHYLISAWSPATVTPLIESTLDEHALLYDIAGVLFRTKSFNPNSVYPANSTPLNSWPEPFRNFNLPIVVVSVEGFNKLAEFWSGMGRGALWKPVIYLVVTLPVELIKEISGPMVTTRITEYGPGDNSEKAEVWIQIGGTVTDRNGNPAGGAWVRLQTPTGEPLQTATTKEEERERGRFTFSQLKAGAYQLRVRLKGHTQATKDIQVPSITGNYDVNLT
jgi:hypothetical protein